MFREQLPAPPRLGRLHSILRGRRRTLENHSPICESAAGTGGSGQGHGPPAARPALGGRKPPCLCVSSPALSLLLSYGSSCRIFGTVPRPSREGLSSSREAIRIAAGSPGFALVAEGPFPLPPLGRPSSRQDRGAALKDSETSATPRPPLQEKAQKCRDSHAEAGAAKVIFDVLLSSVMNSGSRGELSR